MSFGQYSDRQRPEKPSIEKTSTKRLKHVFDNPAHVWAHPLEKDGSGFEQTEAWNGGKNFYFRTVEDTRVLYSYRDSYPIGSRFIHKKKPVYLVRSGKPYSVTTSSHMNQGENAVPHDAIKFSVPNVSNWRDGRPSNVQHTENLTDYVERINEEIAKYSKAHSLRAIIHAQGNAIRLISQAKAYAKFFNTKLPKLPVVPKLTEERRGKALAFDRSQTERENKRREARDARWAEQRRLEGLSREEKIAAWRAGSSARFWNLTGDGYALLRVKGNNVETSQGVSVAINGLAGAGRLLRFLTACKDAGRPYQRNGHTEHIGNFTVESFGVPSVLENAVLLNPEWVLIAGCHRILWSEIETIREAVNEAYKPE